MIEDIEILMAQVQPLATMISIRANTTGAIPSVMPRAIGTVANIVAPPTFWTHPLTN